MKDKLNQRQKEARDALMQAAREIDRDNALPDPDWGRISQAITDAKRMVGGDDTAAYGHVRRAEALVNRLADVHASTARSVSHSLQQAACRLLDTVNENGETSKAPALPE